MVEAVPLALGAWLALAGSLGIAALLAMSVALGVIDTLRGTAAQAYVFDVAGSTAAANAIALANLGGFVAGIVGAVIGGAFLEASGAAGSLALAALMAAFAGVLLLPARADPRPEVAVERPVPSMRSALTLLARNRVVAVVAFIVIVAEILGFSCATLFPAFARDVLGSDAAGLGAITAARYAGSIGALLAIARASRRAAGGPLILLMTGGLGISLVAFSVSRSLALSLLLVGLVGVASAGLDAVVQTLLQRSVDDTERGASIGVWYFAIGFGPLGQLGLGAAAGAIGAPLALATSGLLLALIAVGLSLSPRVRRIAAALDPPPAAG